MLCDYRALLQADPFLEKYEGPLARRARTLLEALDMLPGGESLADVADAHQYYGFHQVPAGWVFRTCAPAARAVSLVGDFNGWDEARCPLERMPGGDWEALFAARCPAPRPARRAENTHKRGELVAGAGHQPPGVAQPPNRAGLRAGVVPHPALCVDGRRFFPGAAGAVFVRVPPRCVRR